MIQKDEGKHGFLLDLLIPGYKRWILTDLFVFVADLEDSVPGIQKMCIYKSSCI